MTPTDLTVTAAWTAKFDGSEQYAVVPFGADSPLAGATLTVMVLCDARPFTHLDREHARLRCEGLARNLMPALERMMRHLSVAELSVFLAQHTAPTLMLSAGDNESWSLSFEHRGAPYGGIFCDWRGDTAGDVWLAE